MKILCLIYMGVILSLAGFSQQSIPQISVLKDQKTTQYIANWMVQSEASGMTIISNSIPPIDKGCEALEIKNGGFSETVNG